jgi:hypothetical protein
VANLLLPALLGRPPLAGKPLSWRLSFYWVQVIERRLRYFGGWPVRWWTRPVRWFGNALYTVRRWCQGARDVETGETAGSFCAPDCEIDFGGMVPVQGEGWVLDARGNRRDCYYRSRGEGWQFHVAALDGEVFGDGEWVYERYPYMWPEGGYVSARVSCDCIGEALDEWRQAEGA